MNHSAAIAHHHAPGLHFGLLAREGWTDQSVFSWCEKRVLRPRVLDELDLVPLEMSQQDSADHIGHDVKVMNRIVNGRSAVGDWRRARFTDGAYIQSRQH